MLLRFSAREVSSLLCLAGVLLCSGCANILLPVQTLPRARLATAQADFAAVRTVTLVWEWPHLSNELESNVVFVVYGAPGVTNACSWPVLAVVPGNERSVTFTNEPPMFFYRVDASNIVTGLKSLNGCDYLQNFAPR